MINPNTKGHNLYSVREIIKSLGATFHVVSEPNKGTIFSFAAPVTIIQE